MNELDYLFGGYSASSGGPSSLSADHVEVTISSMGRHPIRIAAITPTELYVLMMALGSPVESAERDCESAQLSLASAAKRKRVKASWL